MLLVETEKNTLEARSIRAKNLASVSQSTLRQAVLLFALWLAVFFASLWTPPLLDDADATHAEAAQAMLRTGDWITLHVDGVRYLEKAPLPYWFAAISIRLFGPNAFAVHLPLALAVLGLAALAWSWSRRVFGPQAGFYAAIAVLTSAGVFLFTRIFIPEALLSLILCFGLFSILRALDRSDRHARSYARAAWVTMALGVLTKGLIAIVFLGGATLLYLACTDEWRSWRRLRPYTGLALFVAIAAPWHILAGLRNTNGASGHGFFWFYFVNEHFLRFLGHRVPRDYNKLPWYLFWSLHLVWLFPWSLFAPTAAIEAWRHRRELIRPRNDAQRTALLLTIFSVLLLVFFSLSTNQEYYTFPAYLPLLMLITFALVRNEQAFNSDATARRALLSAHAVFTLVGVAASIALAYGLWTSRHLQYVPDIGNLLARRGVGGYTLSMSHFFDLTPASFAALRLPAALAAVALALGPGPAWWLRIRRKHTGSTVAVALTSAVFLVAAHIALVRFSSMLSSRDFAQRIQQLQQQGSIAPGTEVLLFGDQSYGSSIPFYLHRQVGLVDGRSTSMLFGSMFPDVPPVFWTENRLLNSWGQGPRKLLFVPEERRTDAEALHRYHSVYILEEESGKALLTDRPLDPPGPLATSH